MDMLMKLWLAVLLAAAVVWFWSFVSWGLARLHRADYRGIEREDAAMDAVRSMNLAPGNYMFPYMAPGADPAAAKLKWERGPIGTLAIFGKINMGMNLLLTFVVYFVACGLIGYLAAEALPPGAAFGKVMQVVGTAGVLAFTFAGLPHLIWFQGHKSAIAITIIDGVVQGLAAGAVFALMWPGK